MAGTKQNLKTVRKRSAELVSATSDVAASMLRGVSAAVAGVGRRPESDGALSPLGKSLLTRALRSRDERRGPDPFAVAVRVALSRLGRRPYELAAAAGENKDKVYGWLNGRRSVRACTAARLLAACGLGIVVDPGMAKGLGVAPLSAKAGVGAGVAGERGAA